MANIQAALNNLLSSATTSGAYFYTHTPEFAEKKEKELLNRKGKNLNKLEDIYLTQYDKLIKEKPELPENRDLTEEEQATYDTWKNKYDEFLKSYEKLGKDTSTTAQELLERTGDPKYLDIKGKGRTRQEEAKVFKNWQEQDWNRYANASNERAAEEEFRRQSIEAYEEEQEQNRLYEQNRKKQGPVQSITKKTDNARSQLEALIERRDLLSSKERGQLKTMLGRHKNKGEL